MARPDDPALPRRRHDPAPDLVHAVEHARLLRAAGDPQGAARLLDRAFDAEGPRARPTSERLRFRALLLRADLALQLHDADAVARLEAQAGVLHVSGLFADALQLDALRSVVAGLVALDATA